ncbi:MAG: NAD(P)H-dependent oxidoreductase [Clostridia bacterium]|nr:NAD(P)H-dependent oxidoreductase [Clostridia bacterium]
MERTERVLFVNACVRKESRTKRLADAFLEAEGLPFDEIRLSVTTFPISDEAFLEERDRRLRNGEFGHPMFDHARRFASADVILIAAPFWDLSFPTVL